MFLLFYLLNRHQLGASIVELSVYQDTDIPRECWFELWLLGFLFVLFFVCLFI